MSSILINGTAFHIPLADKSVQCVATSPPFYSLRDYGVDGQIGLEKTPEEYVEKIVLVFREVWRVLRDDGTVWANFGDTFAGGGRGGNPEESQYRKQATNTGSVTGEAKEKWPVPVGLKPKDLIGIPWLVAFALRADGWYLRSDIVWAKPNPMPESVTDRPTKSHEYIFLLAKKERYFYDAEAIREPNADAGRTNFAPGKKVFSDGYEIATGDRHRGFKNTEKYIGAGRNRRDVWTIPTKSYRGAHFATWPPDLVEPMILAGSSDRACEICGSPWERITKRGASSMRSSNDGKGYKKSIDPNAPGHRAGIFPNKRTPILVMGFRPSCTCCPNTVFHLHCDEGIEKDHADCRDCRVSRSIVLDPFVGSGTTVAKAIELGRIGIGMDLSMKYLVENAKKRIELVQPRMMELG